MELPTSSPGTTDKGRVWRHWSNHIHHRTTMQTPPWPTNVPFRSSQMAPNVSFGLPMNLNYATNQTFERRTLRWFQLRWWTPSEEIVLASQTKATQFMPATNIDPSTHHRTIAPILHYNRRCKMLHGILIQTTTSQQHRFIGMYSSIYGVHTGTLVI
jgi:hypothetical protein